MQARMRVLNRRWAGLVVLQLTLLVHLLLYLADATRGNSPAFYGLAAIVSVFSVVAPG